MSSRKIIRNGMRRDGELKKVKPSKWLHFEFERYQNKKYGRTLRKIHEAKGTHKRRTWRSRIEAALG